MRLRHLIILIISILCLSALAEEYDTNIYIYRNDGKFTAFLAGEVDSLKYSRIDIEGVEHEHNVVQEIWTADSVYRIPLSVIDSISIYTPEVIFAPGVKHLNPDYTPYLVRADSLSLDFALDMPYNLRIKKGDILVYDRFDNLFQYGFAGRVVSVTSNDVISVKCEAVDLSDIYEQYIVVGAVAATPPAQQSAHSRLKGEIDGSVELEFKPGNSILNASAKLGLSAKITAFITKENKYIAVDFASNNRYQVGLGGDVKLKNYEYNTPPAIIPMSSPVPTFMISADVYGKFLASLEGSLHLSVSQNCSLNFCIIYDNGKITHTSPIVNVSPMEFDGSVEAKGSATLGLTVAAVFRALGNIMVVSVENIVGPVIDFEYSKSSDNLSARSYDILKDASINFALQYQRNLKVSTLKSKYDTSINPKLKLWERQYHFVPEFSDVLLEADNMQITANTKVARQLFAPCKVGFRIFDEDNIAIDTYYDEKYSGIAPAQEDYELNATFDRNLKPGVKYRVSPMVKFLGFDIEASPDDEIYLDCSLITGQGLATTYSVEVSGSTEVEFDSVTEVGFVYSATNKNPTIENSQHCKGQMVSNNTFKSGFSGLKAGTTYYYRAYAFYNDRYYYGDTQCITTKRNSDRADDDNFGGDFKKGRKPYASTGGAFDAEERKAKIELTFSCVNPDTECGYYLEADDKRGSKIMSKYYSLGTVTGLNTIELDNLLPGTTYRYWASEKNSLGSSLGNSRTFKTLPSPDPTGTVVEVTDIDMKSATVKCFFDNLEIDYNCGIILTDGKWRYTKSAKPDAGGTATVKLDRLNSETNYKVNTYITVDEEEEPIIEAKTTSFKTEGPDITGDWLFYCPDVFSAGPNFDLEIRKNGRTNSFFGVNYLYWTRSGRQLTMKLNNNVGGYVSPTYYEFRGEFNEDFTYASGRVYYIHDAEWVEIYDELFDAGPFTLRRK